MNADWGSGVLEEEEEADEEEEDGIGVDEDDDLLEDALEDEDELEDGTGGMLLDEDDGTGGMLVEELAGTELLEELLAEDGVLEDEDGTAGVLSEDCFDEALSLGTEGVESSSTEVLDEVWLGDSLGELGSVFDAEKVKVHPVKTRLAKDKPKRKLMRFFMEVPPFFDDFSIKRLPPSCRLCALRNAIMRTIERGRRQRNIEFRQKRGGTCIEKRQPRRAGVDEVSITSICGTSPPLVHGWLRADCQDSRHRGGHRLPRHRGLPL